MTGRGRAPRPGEDVNVGAIFRLAPGLIEPPPGVEGTVELIVEANGDERPERHYRLIASRGRLEISEADSDASAAAVVRGSQDAWVRALGPDGSSDELSFNGNRGLADQVLSGFTAAAAAPPPTPERGRRGAPGSVVGLGVVRRLDVREVALEAALELEPVVLPAARRARPTASSRRRRCGSPTTGCIR